MDVAPENTLIISECESQGKQCSLESSKVDGCSGPQVASSAPFTNVGSGSLGGLGICPGAYSLGSDRTET